jgi:hypothetical protein
MDRLFRTPPPPLGPRRPAPKSVRGPLAGPRSPAPRPRARRGAPVLRYHSHRVRLHHNHHHRRVRRRQQHLGMVSPRGTSSSSRNSGRPASRVAGRSRAPSEWSPFLLISLFIMPTCLNPSFACQGFLPLCSQGRASTAPGCYRRDGTVGPLGSSCGFGCGGANTKWCHSGGGGPYCPDGRHSLHDDDAIEYTVGSGRGGRSCARRLYQGRRGGRV